MHGEGKGFVLDQPWWGDGAGRARDHPLLSGRGDARTGSNSRVPVLLYLGGAKFGGGKAGCGEGDRLRCGPGVGSRVQKTCAWWRRGGCIGGMSTGIGGSGVTKESRAR